MKLQVYPIEKAIDNSNKHYVTNILPNLFNLLNEKIKKESENGYHSATLVYKYPSFYSEFQIKQIKDVVKKFYGDNGYIVDCDDDPYYKIKALIIKITWKE